MKANERDKLFSLVKVSFLKKSFVTAILVISVFAMFTTAVAGAGDPPCTCGDICVNETGWWRAGGAFNANDTPIQTAVDFAAEGDTICVKDGTYTENVAVTKRLTIRSENGSDSTIVNAADSNEHVFNVAMDYVNISGFTVKGATDCHGDCAGIYLDNVDHNHGALAMGICLDKSGNNTLRNNLMSGNIYNFEAEGFSYSELDNDIDISNLVDGKPIYYLVDASGTVIDSATNAGTVYCINCDNVTVKDLNLTKNGEGIHFYNTSNSRIENNCIGHCFDGIRLWSSSNNIITGNSVRHVGYGIVLWMSSGNTITGNNAYNSLNHPLIALDRSDNNTVTNNNVIQGYSGVFIRYSSNNTIANNTVSNTYVQDGIKLQDSDNNVITDNNVSNSLLKDGINLEGSSNNTISGNTVTSNKKYGICLDFSSNNLIYNNYFNNTHNAWDDGNNIWNITKTLGTNIIGGPYLGGNYWSDYAGTDTDGDGLGDTLLPYNSSSNIANGGDYLPLVPVQKPTVSITTDKFSYKTGDTITITIDLYNPTEDNVTFQWYWGVPQSDIWLLVTSVPIPAGYNDTINISFSIPNLGSTPSGSVFYVQLLDGSGEVLDADVAWWASSPSPGRFMEAMSVDLSKEIAKIIDKVELPM
jgi:parallel beta-helix repeat protein